MLKIAEKFDEYPGEELDLEQFVNIMKESMEKTSLSKREDFI